MKTVIIKLVVWVKYDTLSEEISAITSSVFIAQFFNTGILLTLVNANTTEHSPSWFWGVLNGKFYDYVPAWYSGVGELLI